MAHCVLLGHKYTLKKTCLSFDASSFDESYASPGHNGKNHGFYPEALKEKPEKLFSEAPSMGSAQLGPIKALGTSQLVPC